MTPRRCCDHARRRRRAVEGSEAARLDLRRADHGLRLHAGDGAGQRPPRGLRGAPRRSGAGGAGAPRDVESHRELAVDRPARPWRPRRRRRGMAEGFGLPGRGGAPSARSRAAQGEAAGGADGRRRLRGERPARPRRAPDDRGAPLEASLVGRGSGEGPRERPPPRHAAPPVEPASPPAAVRRKASNASALPKATESPVRTCSTTPRRPVPVPHVGSGVSHNRTTNVRVRDPPIGRIGDARRRVLVAVHASIVHGSLQVPLAPVSGHVGGSTLTGILTDECTWSAVPRASVRAGTSVTVGRPAGGTWTIESQAVRQAQRPDGGGRLGAA